MKIALLHYAAPPVVGGVESVLGHHALLMARDGQEVAILAGRGAQTDPRLAFISLPLLDSRHPEVLAVKAELDAGLVSQRFTQLSAQIEESLTPTLAGFDFLIAHNVCSLNKNLALTAALQRLSTKPAGPRLILWHHDLAWTTPRYQAELHPGQPWDLLRTDWPGVTQVTISEPRRQELAGLLGVPAEHIQLIPNGVDPPGFLKLSPQTCQLVDQLDLLSADPLLLLPVRITSRKNIELAVRALAPLRQSFPQARLLVTGPLGPHNPANLAYFDQLRALRAGLGLEQAVVFMAEQSPEYLPDEVIADFYRLADGLLLPSREEGFGIPLLEAGLARLAVFCADIPPLRELGRDSAAYFSPDADPAALAELIAARLAADPVYELHRRVLAQFTWQQIYLQRIKPLLTG